jgi:hypothetical protein
MVRILPLAGLDAHAGQAILQAQGLSASAQEAHALAQH